MESDPELILVESYLQWNHGNFIRLGELEEKMNPLYDGLENDSYVRDEFHFFVGFNSLFMKGDLPSALNNFELAMEAVPESAAEPRGVVELHYMIFGQFGGTYDKVCQMFYELIEQDLSPIRKNRVFQGFLAASLDQGNMNEVKANYLNAISYVRESKMKDALGLILYMAGSMKLRMGDWNNAINYFNEIMDIRYFVHTRLVVDSLSGLIIIHSMMNEKSKADEVINILEKYTEGYVDFFKTFLRSTKIRYHIINRDYDEVKEYLTDFKTGVLDLVMWLDVPEITHARALIFEGSTENLEKAEEELAQLEGITNALQNRLHLVEVKVLQAVLFDKKGKRAKAKEALLSSIQISAPEGMISFYVELGEELNDLLSQLKEKSENAEFIDKILEEINKIKQRVSDKPAIESRKDQREKLNLLTAKEMEILKCISEGFRNQEIADQLYNSELTIKKHISNMLNKMQVRNRLSLVKKAKEIGII